LVALDGRDCWVSARREEAARALVDRIGSDTSLIGWGEGLTGAVVVVVPLIVLGAGLVVWLRRRHL